MRSVRSRLQRAVDAALDRLRPAVERRPPRLEVEAELGRDHDLVANGLERLADELLVGERAVHLRGVEERDAALDRRADQRDHFLPVGDRADSLAHAHAAEPDRRDLQVALQACASASSSSRCHRLSCSTEAGPPFGCPTLLIQVPAGPLTERRTGLRSRHGHPAEPGSKSEEALHLLVSWTATLDEEQAHAGHEEQRRDRSRAE